jgi:aconitate hydratase
MGVLPCQFEEGTDADTLKLDGTETFDLTGIGESTRPRQKATLVVTRKSGEKVNVPVIVRIDTPIEVDYFRHGGILPYVLRQLMA